jgi:hypothetical protein
LNKIEDRSTAQSAKETAGPSNIRKSQSLLLEKQIMRTLTGAELKRVGGGTDDSAKCTHTHTTR